MLVHGNVFAVVYFFWFVLLFQLFSQFVVVASQAGAAGGVAGNAIKK